MGMWLVSKVKLPLGREQMQQIEALLQQQMPVEALILLVIPQLERLT
jgi:hypothetical protein